MSEWSAGSVELPWRGSRLRVAYAERPSPGGAELPLVYLHGLGSSGRDFAPASRAPELAGRRLMAVDLPGAGESRVQPGEELTIEDLVVVVEAFLGAVGLGQIHLVGHSMGGLIGLLVAARRPEWIATFSNVEGNLAPIDCRVFSRRVGELAARLSAADIVDVLASELAASGRPDYATFAQRFRTEVQHESFVRYCQSIVEVTEERPLLELFKRLDCPRLFVYGERNRDLPYLRDLERAGVDLAEIAQSDHFPIYSDPEGFFAALGGFIERHGEPEWRDRAKGRRRGGSR